MSSFVKSMHKSVLGVLSWVFNLLLWIVDCWLFYCGDGSYIVRLIECICSTGVVHGIDYIHSYNKYQSIVSISSTLSTH
jgi:hypothetical protein